MAPLCVKRWLFPARQCAPVLAVVKQTALDDGSKPVAQFWNPAGWRVG